jgi:cell division protein FtsQ
VWADVDVLARRVRAHPLVADARVERRLPGTLHVVVTEKVPVAISPVRDGFAVYDSAGRALPIDPSRVGGVDAPVVAGRDTSLLRLLAELRAAAPRLFARVSEARRVVRSTGSGDRDEIELAVAVAPALTGADPSGPRPTLVIRAMSDLSAARLADLLPVERDLERRRARVAEIDLRFRDQVIARLQ